MAQARRVKRLYEVLRIGRPLGSLGLTELIPCMVVSKMFKELGFAQVRPCPRLPGATRHPSTTN